MSFVSRATTSTRRLFILASATLVSFVCVSGVARAQGETAAALASPAPDFDANVITNTIRASLSRLREIYENRLRTNPHLAGRLRIEFRAAYGLVIDDVTVVENTTGDEEFGKEIGAAFLTFAWPSTPLLGGTVRFSYPFVFAPQP